MCVCAQIAGIIDCNSGRGSRRGQVQQLPLKRFIKVALPVPRRAWSKVQEARRATVPQTTSKSFVQPSAASAAAAAAAAAVAVAVAASLWHLVQIVCTI